MIPSIRMNERLKVGANVGMINESSWHMASNIIIFIVSAEESHIYCGYSLQQHTREALERITSVDIFGFIKTQYYEN